MTIRFKQCGVDRINQWRIMEFLIENKDAIGIVASFCTLLISIISIYIAVRVHKESKNANRPYLTVTRQYLPDGTSGVFIENKGMGPALIFHEEIQIDGVPYSPQYCEDKTDEIFERYPDGNPVFNSVTRTVAISAGEKMYLFQVNGGDKPLDYLMEDIYKFEVYIEYQSLQGHKMKVNWNHPVHENLSERKFIGKPIKLK